MKWLSDIEEKAVDQVKDLANLMHYVRPNNTLFHYNFYKVTVILNTMRRENLR
ncbi:hypothetical protein DSO57_1020340 [Entomophthora muscae]|nr:hypothetical protein DSO57_1020340 [Entomophthora muscae]